MKKIYLTEKELINVIKNRLTVKENSMKSELDMTEDENDIAMAASEIDPDLGLAMMKEYEEEEDDYDPRNDLIESLKLKIESGEDLDESDIRDIYDDGKPFRRGRGSIYVDILVPETDDREFDRQVANKMMEYYSKQVKDENYVGGVGFRNQGNIIQPYDKDF
jgi:hypothetical protein